MTSARTVDYRLHRLNGSQLVLPNAWGIPVRLFAGEGVPIERAAVTELLGLLELQDTIVALAEQAPDLFDHPDPGIAAVALSSDFHKGSGIPIGTRRRRAFLELVMSPTLLAATDRDTLAARLAPIFGRDLGVAPAVQGAQLAAMRAYNATPRLRELAGLPTLVVSAAHDPIAPPSAGRALAAGIPGARSIEVAQASHGLPIQEAAATTTMLEAHFALAEGGAGGQ